MQRTLLTTGGIINTIFFAFHILLGIRIHGFGNVAPALRALMELLNLSGTLMIGYFALVSFSSQRELLATRLGRMTLGLIIALYGTRALGEWLISPRFSLLIFLMCLLTAALYLAQFLIPGTGGKAATAPAGLGR